MISRTISLFAAPLALAVIMSGCAAPTDAPSSSASESGEQDLTSTAFTKWYNAKKGAATITRDPSVATPTS